MENSILKNLQYVVKVPTISLSCGYVMAESIEQKRERERTTILKRTFLESLDKSLGTVIGLCASLNIHRSTYYVWMKNDPQFKTSVEAIRKNSIEDVENSMVREAIKGNTAAARLILVNKHPDYKRGKIENHEVHIYYHHAAPSKPVVKSLDQEFEETNWMTDKEYEAKYGPYPKAKFNFFENPPQNPDSQNQDPTNTKNV